jgi:rubrerythrin
MKKWRCVICDYIHEGEEAPESCPLCGVDATNFEEVE